MSTLTGTSFTASLGSRLDADWSRLATSAAAATALATWRCTEPVLVGYHNFEALREVVHDRADLERSDRVLAALVRLAAVTGHDDSNAAWLVVQLLKPGAIHLAARLAPMVGDQATSEQLVFAELTIRVRGYPWQRRPQRIAANLLLDCRQRIVRDQRRHRPELPVDPFTELPDRAVPEPLDEPMAVRHLLWLAQRRRVLTRREVELLTAVYLDDTPIDQLTGVFGWSRTTLFALRAAAERRLRDAFDVGEPAQTRSNGPSRQSANSPPPPAVTAASSRPQTQHAGKAA
jgi:hypothetical protein